MGFLDFLTGGSKPSGNIQSNYLDSAIPELRNSPNPNILNSDAFAKIRALLAPPTDGGLNPNLQGMYDSGARSNAMGASAAGASAKSDAVGRGLEGSSVEAYGVNNAKFAESMANSDLMAKLFGMQNQNSNNLAGMEFQGASAEDTQVEDRLKLLMQLLSGQSESNANIGMFNTEMDANNQLADKQMMSNLMGALITGGASIYGKSLGGR